MKNKRIGKTELKIALENRKKLGGYTGNEKAWKIFLKKESAHRRMRGRR